MSEVVTIEAVKRDGRGKGYARKLRVAGKIPGIIIGKEQSTPIELNPKLLHKAWKNDRKFNLSFEGSERTVKIQEIQVEPVKRTPIHVDLMDV